MSITRRDFAKKIAGGAGLFFVGGSLPLVMTGCNVGNDILTWEPIALAAFNSGVSALEAFGIITGTSPEVTTVIAAIRLGFTDLAQDVQLYEAINPPPVGAIQQISAVLNLLASNLKDFFALIVTTLAPAINLIIGLGQLLLGTIAAFMNKINSTPGVLNVQKVTPNEFRLSGVVVSYVPLNISPTEFKNRWNKVCVSQGHPEIEIK